MAKEKARKGQTPAEAGELYATVIKLVPVSSNLILHPDAAEAVLGGHGAVTVPAAQVEGQGVVTPAGTLTLKVVTEDHTSRDQIEAEDLKRGALERNLTRTGGAYQLGAFDQQGLYIFPDRVWSADSWRVLTVLQGMTVASGSRGCLTHRGEHEDGCAHQNRLAYTFRSLARATFSHDGGASVQRVRDSLRELYASEAGFYLFDPESGQYLETRHRLIADLSESGRNLRPGDPPQAAQGILRWGPDLYDSLMAGAFTYIPMAMVRDLKGPAFLLWRDILTDRVTAGLKNIGDKAEYTVTGREARHPVRRLGLRATRPGRVREQLEKYAAQGSEIARHESGLEMRIEARTDRRKGYQGLKAVMTKVARTVVAGGAYNRGSERVQSWQEARTVVVAIESESDAIGRVIGRDKRLETLSANAETGASSPSKPRRRARKDDPPDVAALLERGWRRSEKQRGSLDEIAERHNVRGRAWAEAIIRATPEGEDAFRAVLLADKAWQQERAKEIAALERAWEAEKATEAEDVRSLAESLKARGLVVPDLLSPPSPEPEEE